MEEEGRESEKEPVDTRGTIKKVIRNQLIYKREAEGERQNWRNCDITCCSAKQQD
jgi:hypothetical protein